MSYTHFLSDVVKRRSLSGVAKFSQLAKGNPNAITFSAGFPNPETFPFSEMTVSLSDGKNIKIDSVLMAECLQYGKAKGFQPLIDQLKSLIQRLHDLPCWKELDVVVVPGSQDGLHKVFEMMINPNDVVLVPEPCYSGVFIAVKGFEPQLVSVKCDSKGMKPDCLKEALARCKVSSKGVPKLLYANPNGSNPDGTVWSESRRRQIYDLACQHNIIILEDDPYYFLQFDEEFPPSFLQLDRERRVIRLDSFSKTLGAGFRIGYVTGPTPLMDVLTLQVQSTVNHVSLISQACVSEMMKALGIDGFLQKAKQAQQFYKTKRDVMITFAEKYLQDLCEWTIPAGGFFLWLKVAKLQDTREMILERGLERGFLAMPGCGYHVNMDAPSQYLRVSYSCADHKTIEEGFKVLADIIREEMKHVRTSVE